MPYKFSNDSINQEPDPRKLLGARKKPDYDYDYKFSYDTSKDSILDDSIDFVSQRNTTEQAGHILTGRRKGQTAQLQQKTIPMDLYDNSAEPIQENQQTQYKWQIPTKLMHRSEQPEKQLFYQQKIHKPVVREYFKDECSKPAEHENEEKKGDSEHLVYQPFTETFRNMTVHDLIDQCQDHVCVINTCNILQKIITEEIMKQVKLDDIVCQKLTGRSQRLQQQSAFLEKVRAPVWVKAALEDLSSRAIQRAQAYKTHAVNLLKECQAIQNSMDETQELGKTATAAGAADRSQESKDDEETRNETSLNSTQTSKTTDEVEDKRQCKSFLHINDRFEGIRKPWMKLLSLLEYQQEQYDATLTQMDQVENEIEELVSTEEVENSPWRAQIKKKDLETKKELLEARQEHLEADVSNAKKDIGDFELNNRDNIMDVLNALRQHRNRCDSLLRENFQLLLTASLRDPTCFIQHINKHDHEPDDVETSNNKQTCVAGKYHDSWRYMNSTKDHHNEMQMCGDISYGQETTCTSFKNQDFSQSKSNAVMDVPNNADFISKPPLRDFKGSRFQHQKHLYSYTLLSDSESGVGSKTNTRDVSPQDAIKGRYINTKQGYGADGYRSPSSDFNTSRSNKESPLPTADGGVCDERVDAGASPICNDDSKTTSWSMSSGQAVQHCHMQFKSSAFVADNAEKTSQLAKEGYDKEPYTAQPSLYQDICGREYNSHRFPVGINEQSPSSNDGYQKDVASNQRYYRTGITTPDILTNKEFRAAYFINKYAGARQSDRSFLIKNMHGQLAWRGDKDFSVKKLGRGCHENGGRRSRDNLTKRGSNKRKRDSNIVKESSVGLEEEDSSSCQDAYSSSSGAADGGNRDLQNTPLQQTK